VNAEKRDQINGEDQLAVTVEGQLAAVTAERDQLIFKKGELQERLKRSLADFDNARKRFEQQRSDYVQFAATVVILVEDRHPEPVVSTTEVWFRSTETTVALSPAWDAPSSATLAGLL
jgi:hypothetical protein